MFKYMSRSCKECIEAIDNAIKQLRQCLQYDKK